MTHDYVRNGTTNLFAAFDLASESVIARHYRRHRYQLRGVVISYFYS
jgi:hypothetical protein